MACNGRALQRAIVHQGTVAAICPMLPSTLGAGNVSSKAASVCMTRYAVGPLLLLSPLSPSLRARALPASANGCPRPWRLLTPSLYLSQRSRRPGTPQTHPHEPPWLAAMATASRAHGPAVHLAPFYLRPPRASSPLLCLSLPPRGHLDQLTPLPAPPSTSKAEAEPPSIA